MSRILVGPKNGVYVTIEEVQYSGTDEIDVTVLSDNFVIYFHSDGSVTSGGFQLSWSCAGTVDVTFS